MSLLNARRLRTEAGSSPAMSNAAAGSPQEAGDGWQSCLYLGRVWHRRSKPRPHAFSYRLYFVYLDLDELPRLFDGRWLWSAQGFNLAWFRRHDHLGPPERPLKLAVADLVEQRLGFRPTGPIRLLTQIRYLGVAMNPVSFYYCFAPGGAQLQAVVAEVHNTPWNERHCYVLDARRGPGRR